MFLSKRLRLFLALGLTLLSTGLRAETLVFSPLPMEQPEEVVKQVKPMLNYLEKVLGVRIEIRYYTSYEAILENFRQGEIDVTYLGPLPYIALKDKFPAAQPLVHFLEKSGQATYTCALVGTDKAPPRGMTGRTLALTQPLSTCGYLSADALLRERGSQINQNRFRYLGTHDEVALAVARGDFDFGALKTAIGRNYSHLGLKVLAETAPLPSFALVANTQRLSEARRQALREALTRLDPKGDGKALMADWGNNIRHGSIPASDQDYDILRRMRGQRSIPEQGNF